MSVHLGTPATSRLSPATTYHYRVLATNEIGATTSTEGSFTTPGSPTAPIADERDWEMVSPPDRDGASVLPLGGSGSVIQSALDGAAVTYIASGSFAAPEGNRAIEHTQILSTRAAPGSWSSKDLVTPSSSGEGLEAPKLQEYQFFSQDLALSLLHPPTVGGPLAEPPLSPPASEAERQCAAEGKPCQEKTIYLRDDQPIEPASSEAASFQAAELDGESMGNPGYLALVSALNAPGVQFGGYEDLQIVGATPDLAHVLIASETHLASPFAPAANLYEWSAQTGVLEPVNVLPEGTPRSAQLGGPGVEGAGAAGGVQVEDFAHAVSTDGARVIFSPLGEPEHLYMRDLAVSPAQTIALDTPQSGASGDGPSKPRFQTASADGSRVFFTDERQLTEGSGAGQGRFDLYVFEVTSGAGEPPAGRLTDLTKAYAGQDAEVQGRVLGASEDGSYVYFVANGVLSAQAAAAHASRGDCQEEEEAASGATCNLYVAHYDGEAGHEGWEAPRFIAALSGEDRAGAWRSDSQGAQTARVSPNGLYLAFMSDRGLTSFEGRPYDTDATSPAADGAPAEEVYEYAAPTAQGAGEAGRLTCVSCDPSGARPAGVLDPPEQAGGRAALLIDPDRQWGGRWLAGILPAWAATEAYSKRALYQSRFLSNSGRLYFDSAEPLVPEATNATQDVYEYEPEGVPRGAHECTGHAATFSARSQGCIGLISSGSSASESVFLDASEAGGEGEDGEELDEGGGDVFFVTAAQLTATDAEAGYALFDAHECTLAEPCAPAEETHTEPECDSTAGCRPFSYSPPSEAQPAPDAGPGNLTPQHSVLPSKTAVKPKPLTRAQKLAKALKACHKDKHRRKRVACEKQARRAYGPPPKERATTRKGGRS